MIDFLTTIPGLKFAEAWEAREVADGEFPIYFLGKEDLIRSKEAAGRPQDLADIDELRKL